MHPPRIDKLVCPLQTEIQRVNKPPTEKEGKKLCDFKLKTVRASVTAIYAQSDRNSPQSDFKLMTGLPIDACLSISVLFPDWVDKVN